MPKTDALLAISNFHSSDLFQDEIQQMPNDLQEIFEMVLDSNYGDSLKIRQKMLRIKKLVTHYAKTLAPFTEDQIQQCCRNYQNQLNLSHLKKVNHESN